MKEKGEELVDYIPGIPSIRAADLPSTSKGANIKTLERVLECVSLVSNAQCLIFNSVYELEAPVVDALKTLYPFPVYSLGPTVPYLDLNYKSSTNSTLHYMEWLNSQPEGSVLYISMGSFLSVSSAQMDEIVAGVVNSGVRFLWVSREDTGLFKNGCGNTGVVVPWCDQLKVLCHSSVGGFWTHCGWNSTLEAVFGGVPMLASPIIWDQITDSKNIVEDWKIGWRVRREDRDENLVQRGEIAKMVQNFMDQENNEVKEMRKRARGLQEMFKAAIAKGGSSYTNLNSFIRDILQG